MLRFSHKVRQLHFLTPCSSEIIRETKSYCGGHPGYLVAYFLFSFREEAKQKAFNLLSSVLAQLVMQTTTISDSLESFYQEHQHGRPPKDGLFSEIKSFLHDPIFIVVDALDECPDNGNERKSLCQILAELHKWEAQNLHILVTSRKEPDITAALSSISTSEPISITEKVKSDIHKYVSTQLATDAELKDYSTELKDKIQRVLVEKAKGM